MALISITVTADTTSVPGLVPILVAAAEEFMSSQNPPINFSGMTNQQKVTRYTRELLMSVYRDRKVGETRTSNAALLSAAEAQAKTDSQNGLT